jgi:hypothetical protein
MTPSAVVADFGSRRYRRFIPFNFLLSLAAPHLHGVLVLVTDNKFINGVVVTGDNCSPVSLSPAIIVHRYAEVGSAIFLGGALSLECYLFLYVH